MDCVDLAANVLDLLELRWREEEEARLSIESSVRLAQEAASAIAVKRLVEEDLENAAKCARL